MKKEFEEVNRVCHNLTEAVRGEEVPIMVQAALKFAFTVLMVVTVADRNGKKGPRISMMWREFGDTLAKELLDE